MTGDRRAAAIVFCVGVALGSMPRASHAQDGASEAQARKAFRSGVQAHSRGELRDAAAHFGRSYVFVPRPTTMFNLAKTEEELGEDVKALAHYELFLSIVLTESDAQVEYARERIGILRVRTQVVVSITSVPSGALIHLENSSQPIGATPARLSLVPGTYRLVLKHPGKADTAKTITVEAAGDADAPERAKLELARDECLRELQRQERRYQIAKDLSDNLTVGYNTSEVIMARLIQTTNAKERVYAQSVSFFGTNETVLTALSASFTGMHGLHESTKTLEAMKEGVSQSLEALAEIGGKVQEAALRAGYGPTIRANAVKTLVESVVNYQTRSREIIEEMRVMSTRNADEIRDAVEDGKRRLARLAEQGNALTYG